MIELFLIVIPWRMLVFRQRLKLSGWIFFLFKMPIEGILNKKIPSTYSTNLENV